MSARLSVVTINAALDAIETAIGTAPTLEIRSGAVPADADTADAGSVLATFTLPSDWLAAASAGSKAKAGTWAVNGSANGTAGHFRIKQGATTHIQGSITATGGGGDMTLANTSIASGQPITIDTFTLNAGGA